MEIKIKVKFAFLLKINVFLKCNIIKEITPFANTQFYVQVTYCRFFFSNIIRHLFQKKLKLFILFIMWKRYIKFWCQLNRAGDSTYLSLTALSRLQKFRCNGFKPLFSMFRYKTTQSIVCIHVMYETCTYLSL